MIDIHSKHDNMHKNVMFYALICITNHIISCIDCMLSLLSFIEHSLLPFLYDDNDMGRYTMPQSIIKITFA